MRPLFSPCAALALSLIGLMATLNAHAQNFDDNGPNVRVFRFRGQGTPQGSPREDQARLRECISQLRGSEKRGWEMISRMVRAEQTLPFIAREVRLSSRAEETEFWVRSHPTRGVRFEGVRPAGRIVLDDRQKVYVYQTSEKRWTSHASLQGRRNILEDLARRLMQGDLRATQDGQDTVAGRTANIVRVEPTGDGHGNRSAPSRRFWVDRATGLRLKHEVIRPDGRLLSSSYYLSVDLKPRFRSDDFTPPASATPVDRDRGRGKREFTSADEARRAGFDVPTPGYLPKGFALRVIEVTPSKRNPRRSIITERYGNGLTVISLTRLPADFPVPFGDKLSGANRSGFIPPPPGMEGRAYTFQEGDYRYFILGTLPEKELQRIGQSVK